MKIRYWTMLALTAALSQSGADRALADPPSLPALLVVCPSVSSISISGPSGWAAVNPSQFIEMKTPPARTNFICLYGGNVAEVKISLIRGCPQGTKSRVLSGDRGVCE